MTYKIMPGNEPYVRRQITEALNELLASISAAISDTAYDATSWNGVTTIAPSKNAVRDELEVIKADYVPDTGDTTIAGIKTFSSDPLIPDEAYGSSWNGVLEPPTKNAVYDKIETLPTTDSLGGWTTIVKSANQDVTNAGLTNDSEFSFSVTANSHYLVEMVLAVSGNDTTGDYQLAFNVGTGTMTGRGSVSNMPTGTDANFGGTLGANAAATTTSSGGTAGTIICGSQSASLDNLSAVYIVFAFTPSSNATFRYRFGNGTPGIGRTSRTWKGSIMRYKSLD